MLGNFVLILLICLNAGAASARAGIFVELPDHPTPENAAIHAGDRVGWEITTRQGRSFGSGQVLVTYPRMDEALVIDDAGYDEKILRLSYLYKEYRCVSNLCKGDEVLQGGGGRVAHVFEGGIALVYPNGKDEPVRYPISALTSPDAERRNHRVDIDKNAPKLLDFRRWFGKKPAPEPVTQPAR